MKKLPCIQNIAKRTITSSSNANKQCSVILGAQWGDEGKGKLVDIQTQENDIVARFNGGANAGHTLVVNNKKFAFHLLPCGVLSPNKINIIGNGTVLDISQLQDEISDVENGGIQCKDRIIVSNRAHIVQDIHKKVDGYSEDTSSSSIGTTRRGIGPTYACKKYRIGMRVGDLIYNDWNTVKDIYNNIMEFYKRMYPTIDINTKEELNKLQENRDKLKPLVDDTITYIHEQLKNGKKILAEGANACLLDNDFGTYPYVTSSNTTIGGAFTGLGISIKHIGDIYGVVKAYTTRVGLGPFPTELKDDIGKTLGQRGHEFGTTTGRARRCGWLDLPTLHYSIQINGFTSINLTKLDVLSTLSTIKICVAYSIKGKKLPIGYIPSTFQELSQVEPIYETLSGWECDISGIKSYDDLPLKAKEYISFIQDRLSIPISYVGVGPDRLNMIKLL